MKKLLFILFIAAGLVSDAQNNSLPPIKKNAIKFNLVSPIFNTINLSYQRMLTPYKSLQVTAAYTNFDDFKEDHSIDKNSVKGLNLTADYRINFSGYGLNGWYISPFARYLNYSKDSYKESIGYDYSYDLQEKSSYQSIGVGLLVGKQFIIKNTITIDLFAGPSFSFLVNQNRKINYNVSSSGNNYYYESFYYDDYRNANVIDENLRSYLGDVIPNNYLRGYGIRAGINIGFAF